MDERERRLELRVGLVLVLCVAAVGALLWLMGDLRPFGEARLAVRFAHTGNVVAGAPVKLGGVEVGRVDRIHLYPERRDEAGLPLPVTMDLSLSEEARAALRSDVAVTVATRGPLGEAYLELEPGSAGAAALPEGAEVRGVEAVRLDQVAARMGQLMDRVGRVLEDNPEAVAQLLRGVGGFSQAAEGVLRENREQIRALFQELTASARQMNALAKVAERQIGPGGKTAELVEEMGKSARLAQEALTGVAAVSSGLTEEDGERLRKAIAAYAEAGEKLDRIAARGERVLARIEAGEGTLGGLVKDDQLYRDLRDLIADLKAHPWKVLWKN
jgi:phospholipid/cholesterol/gamma-HCH transport system substrate-binding protein